MANPYEDLNDAILAAERRLLRKKYRAPATVDIPDTDHVFGWGKIDREWKLFAANKIGEDEYDGVSPLTNWNVNIRVLASGLLDELEVALQQATDDQLDRVRQAAERFREVG